MPSWPGQGQFTKFLHFIFQVNGDTDQIKQCGTVGSALASYVGGFHFDSWTGNWLS